MGVDVGRLVNFAIEYGPRITGIVKGVKSLFGNRKSGKEKKEIVVESVMDSLGVIENATGKDLVNQERLQSLVDRSVEVGYQIMKLEEEMVSLAKEIKELKL